MVAVSVSYPTTLEEPQSDPEPHRPHAVESSSDVWNPFPIRSKAKLDIIESILSRNEDKWQALVSLSLLSEFGQNLLINIIFHSQIKFLEYQTANAKDPQALLRSWIYPKAVTHIRWRADGRMKSALDFYLFRALLGKLLVSFLSGFNTNSCLLRSPFQWPGRVAWTNSDTSPPVSSFGLDSRPGKSIAHNTCKYALLIGLSMKEITDSLLLP